MTRNNTLLSIVLSGFVFLLVLWLIFTKNSEQYTILEQRIEKLSTNLAASEEAFKTLSAEIRQLHIAVNGNVTIDDHSQPEQAFNQFSTLNMDDADSDKEDKPPGSSNLAKPRIPTEHEMASVTLIVDKLRARDMNAYPDFPSLMAAPEISGLSSVARDKVMAEVSRMLESGEIDPSFFPNE